MGVSTMKRTVFEGGDNLMFFIASGAAAGDVTVTGLVKDTDRVLQVLAMTPGGSWATNATFSTADLTSEFLSAYPKGVKADDTLNNTGGTSSANHMLFVVVARKFTS